jgi:GR25 family glycosyltransferase involved in LPS biosynthesis
MRGATRKKLNIFNVPAYVISMKERPERWKRFTEQPSVDQLKHMRYSRAVNGKRLDYKTDPRISVRTRLNIFRNYRRSHHEIATLGAVGCSLSHIEVWKKFIKSGNKYCLVLEDDAIIPESELEHVNELISKLPSGWGVWILGCYKPNLVYEPYSVKPWNRVYKFTASHAYLLTREAAIKLLKDALPVESHVDHYIGDSSVLNGTLVLQHPEVQIEFFQEKLTSASKPTTADSNTSQHKKSGCPVCKSPDDLNQIYKRHSYPTKEGMRVKGLVDGQQADHILRLKRRRTRKK